jgi:hypothetical protein
VEYRGSATPRKIAWSTGGTSEIGCLLSAYVAKFLGPYGREMRRDYPPTYEGWIDGQVSPGIFLGCEVVYRSVKFPI